MRELKAYKAAMQSLPSGCLAAEAEAEKQEKLSVEITGSQTGPMSCSEQTELFVHQVKRQVWFIRKSWMQTQVM